MRARAVGPLAGRRVAVTRRPEQAAEIIELLQIRGAEPLACATIDVEAPASYTELDAALRSIGLRDWVTFTSANAVASVAKRLAELGLAIPATVRLAAVGKATARAVAERMRGADFVPTTVVAESLGMEIPDIAGRRVLWPRGDLATQTLGRVLRARGAIVDEVVAYRTIAGEGSTELAGLVHAGDVDAILFMSASSVRHLLDTMRGLGASAAFAPGHPAVICIGPETARAAREAGVSVSAVAVEKTAEGIVEALERWYGREDDAKRR